MSTDASSERMMNRVSRDTYMLLAREYQSFVQELLPVVDQLTQRKQTAPDSERQIFEGLEAQLLRLLVTHGIRPTARKGGRLDLKLHEVVETVATREVEPETILEVLQMGYEMIPRGLEPVTLRQARVVVAVDQEV